MVTWPPSRPPELDGCEAHVTLAATGLVPRETLQQHRWWTDKEWAEAEARLAQRGWLDAGRRLTEAGRAGRQLVEDTTDALAGGPWDRLGPERSERLAELLAPLARAIVERGGIPLPNPMGMPAP